MDYINNNAKAWDAFAREKQEDGRNKFTCMINHDAYMRAKDGELKVTLTSAKYVPEHWFPPLKNKSVLGLASGGGQQGPVFAAHGADVTIMDVSEGQIHNELIVADREGYQITALKRNMEEPFPFEDAVFDVIFHPVSNCYIENILPVWQECARVIKPNGILMMGFIKEEHFMFEPDFQNDTALISKYSLPFNSLKDWSEEKKAKAIEEKEPFVFSHTLTEQIGGLLQAGFIITDIYEDGDGGGLFDQYMNSYVAVRAVRKP